MKHVLVVEDEDEVRTSVARTLERYDFAVTCVEDAEAGERCLEVEPIDIIILDINLPGASGIEFCRQLRRTRDVPVIFLSGLDGDVDRIVGLEIGADDYLTKPFHPGELLARVRAVLRRTAPTDRRDTPPSPSIERGRIRVDVDEYRVFVDDEPIDLTLTEYNLFKTMMGRPGKVYSRSELMERSYDRTTYVSDRTINSHIRRLRSKLQDAGVDPIDTVRGVGYRFLPQETE